MELMQTKRKGEGRVYPDKRTGMMVVEWYVNGKRFREYPHTRDRNIAEKIRIQRIAERDRGIRYIPVVNKCKFKELADDVLADYKRRGLRTLWQLQLKLNRFILPALGHHKVVHITKPMIDHYGDARANMVTNDTVNHELAIIRRCFSLGAINGKVVNPPYVQLREKAEPRQGFYEWHEAELLSHNLPDYLHNLPLFFFLTGWRLREALTLEWAMVDMANGIIKVPGRLTKNKRDKLYAYDQNSRLATVLADQRTYTDHVQQKHMTIVPFVFHNNGRQIKDFRDAWRIAHDRANLMRRTPHDFRRSLKRITELAGISEVYSMKVMGHESVSVSRNYAVADVSAMRDTSAKIEQQIDKMVKK